MRIPLFDGKLCRFHENFRQKLSDNSLQSLFLWKPLGHPPFFQNSWTRPWFSEMSFRCKTYRLHICHKHVRLIPAFFVWFVNLIEKRIFSFYVLFIENIIYRESTLYCQIWKVRYKKPQNCTLITHKHSLIS